jgi:phosphate transport system permease protein
MSAKRKIKELLIKMLMLLSTLLITGSLLLILGTILRRGLPALDLAMITQIPKGGYYLGKEGGILNAILGSVYLALGATLLSVLISLPVALYLQIYPGSAHGKDWIHLSLDVLWGIPSIVYGAFGFSLMLVLGLRASLLGGIIVLALLEFPIMVRGMEEAIHMVPPELIESSYSLGASRLHTSLRVVTRQALPGLVTAVLLACGRGIGDAASVIFTTGYTDQIPTSLLRPAASLPLAIFFQLNTPFPAVQDRAYAAALVLTLIVLGLSITSRLLSAHFTKSIIR